jgi:hypothetical protein
LATASHAAPRSKLAQAPRATISLDGAAEAALASARQMQAK